MIPGLLGIDAMVYGDERDHDKADPRLARHPEKAVR